MNIPESNQSKRVKNNQRISDKDAARAKRKAQSKRIQHMDEFININSNIRNKQFQMTHATPNRKPKSPKF